MTPHSSSPQTIFVAFGDFYIQYVRFVIWDLPLFCLKLVCLEDTNINRKLGSRNCFGFMFPSCAYDIYLINSSNSLVINVVAWLCSLGQVFDDLSSWKIIAGSTIKCQSQGGSSPWEAVQMVVVTTTTPTLSSVVATGLSQLIYMFQVAHLQLRPCSMESSNCRRRSTGARISRFGGLNKSLLCLCTRYISVFLYLWKNKTKLCWLTLCKLSLLSVRRLFSRDCCSRQAISGVILYPFA